MSKKKLSSSSYDPEVKVSFALTMWAVMQAASNGYTEYIAGQVEASRALQFVRKMDDRYGINLTANQRWKIKTAGGAKFLLFLYPRAHTTEFDWFILKTPGTHPNLPGDTWAPIKKPRLAWAGYELAELPYTRGERENWLERKPNLSTSSWTWCMSADTLVGWKKRIRSALNHLKKSPRKNDQRFRQVLHSLSHVPGFRVARRQVFELRCYTNDQRHRLKLGRHEWSTPIPYLRARACTEYPLSLLVARSLRGEADWFPAPSRGTPSGIFTPHGYRKEESTQEEPNDADSKAPDQPDETHD